MKTFLQVPFKEKDEVRRLGAKWDIARKVWFIENLENIEPFLKWMPDKLKKPTNSKPLKHSKRPKQKEAIAHGQKDFEKLTKLAFISCTPDFMNDTVIFRFEEKEGTELLLTMPLNKSISQSAIESKDSF